MRLLFFLLLFLPLISHAQYEGLLNKKDWELVALLREKHGIILSYDSISALRTLDSINYVAQEHNDDALALEAAYIRADYFLRGKQKNVSKGLLMIDPLLRYARKNQLQLAEARILANFATLIWYTDNDAPKCLRSYLYSLDIADKYPDYQFPEKLMLLHEIAGLYYRFGDNEKARAYALEAIKKDDYKVPEYLYYKHAAINTIGLTYRNKQEYDSALFYLNKAYKSLSETKDSVWRGETWKAIISGNIGIIYMLQGKYAAAKPLLQQDVAYCIAGREYDNALNSLLKLSHISLIEHDTAKAAAQLVQARQLCAIARDTFSPLEDIYLQMAYVAVWRKNKDLALRYHDSILVIKDSLMKKTNAVMVVREALYDQELSFRKEKERAATEHKKEVWRRNTAILLLMSGGGVVVYFLNKRRRHHKFQQQIIRNRKVLADQALKNAKDELAVFTRTISEKNALIENITAQLNAAGQKQQDQSPGDVDTELLLQLQQSILLTDEQWENFQQLFEQAHPGYLSRMEKKYPNLTPAEVRYILLLKLRLSPKEMAGMLGISPSSIRIYRHRLKKKLQLGEEDNLENLAEAI